MKNRFLKGLALFMCASVLAGCGKTPMNEIEESDSVVEDTSSEEIDTAAEDTSVVESDTESDDLTQKCLKGYADYLADHKDLWQGETVYELDFINDDDVPDLIFGGTDGVHASNIYILTYLDGNYDEVVCCGEIGAYNATCYYPKLGIILSTDIGMGYETEYYSELSADSEYGCKTLCHMYSYYEEDYEDEPTEIKFFIGEGEDKEVTQEEYDECVKEHVGDTDYKLFYTYENENGYEYLTQEALDNLFGE